MANKLTIEALTTKPTCGLSVVGWALNGSREAQSKVVAAFPELGEKPPAGLTTMEWAALGLESAQENLTKLLTIE